MRWGGQSGPGELTSWLNSLLGTRRGAMLRWVGGTEHGRTGGSGLAGPNGLNVTALNAATPTGQATPTPRSDCYVKICNIPVQRKFCGNMFGQ